MKNRQHKYILKAYLKSKMPGTVKHHSQLVALDSYLAGYCTQLLKSDKFHIPTGDLITKEEKELFSELIDSTSGKEKDELIIYYRLTVLVETVLSQYV